MERIGIRDNLRTGMMSFRLVIRIYFFGFDWEGRGWMEMEMEGVGEVFEFCELRDCCWF